MGLHEKQNRDYCHYSSLLRRIETNSWKEFKDEVQLEPRSSKIKLESRWNAARQQVENRPPGVCGRHDPP